MCVTQGRMGALVTAVILMICMVGRVKSGAECQNSQSCGDNECCRDASGFVLSSDEGPDGDIPLGVTGTCEMGQAGDQEYCDDVCKCGPGLTCYREMAGIQLPRRCYDSEYVRQQQEYWNNCAPPDCLFPP